MNILYFGVLMMLMLLNGCNHDCNSSRGSSAGGIKIQPSDIEGCSENAKSDDNKNKGVVDRNIDLGIVIKMESLLAALPDKESIDEYVQGISQQSINGNIFFIFADTVRYDHIRKYAPNIEKFMSENTSGLHLAGATATAHSMFSIFHSQPSCLAYFDYLNLSGNGEDKGSIFFRILKAVGYDIYTIGMGLRCIDAVSEPGSWDATLASFFGHKTNLLENCKDTFRAYYPMTVDTTHRQSHYTDDLVVRQFKNDLFNNNRDKENKKAFYFISLDNVHQPFSWDESVYFPYPDVAKFNGMWGYKMLPIAKPSEIKKSYANAVASMDYQFSAILCHIKENNLYESSTIIFISDHGESLGEKTRSINSKALPGYEKNGKMYYHGHTLYKEQIDTPFSIKFPNNININININNANEINYISGMDVFPSILSGLGFNMDRIKPLIKGRSLFGGDKDDERRSYVVALPNGYDYTRKMALLNSEYKIQIQIEEEDFYNSSSFRIVNITDLDDNTIYKNKPFSQFNINNKNNHIKDFDAFVDKINNDFKESIGVLFGREVQ